MSTTRSWRPARSHAGSESEPNRLHKTMETITHNLELERRQGTLLDDKIKGLKKEIEEKK